MIHRIRAIQVAVNAERFAGGNALIVVDDAVRQLRPAVHEFIAFAFDAPVQDTVAFLAPAVIQYPTRGGNILTGSGDGRARTNVGSVALLVDELLPLFEHGVQHAHRVKLRIGVVSQHLAAQIAQAGRHHFNPSAHFTIDDLGLYVRTVLHHEIRVQQTFGIELVHKSKILLVAVLCRAIEDGAVVLQRKCCVSDVISHDRHRDIVSRREALSHRQHHGLAGKRIFDAHILKCHQRFIPIVQRDRNIQPRFIQQVLADHQADEAFFIWFTVNGVLPHIAVLARIGINPREAVDITGVCGDLLPDVRMCVQVCGKIRGIFFNVIVQRHDLPIRDCRIRAAGIRRSPTVIHNVGQVAGRHDQVELLSRLAAGRLLPINVHAHIFLIELPALVFRKGFHLIGRHVLRVHPPGYGCCRPGGAAACAGSRACRGRGRACASTAAGQRERHDCTCEECGNDLLHVCTSFHSIFCYPEQFGVSTLSA